MRLHSLNSVLDVPYSLSVTTVPHTSQCGSQQPITDRYVPVMPSYSPGGIYLRSEFKWQSNGNQDYYASVTLAPFCSPKQGINDTIIIPSTTRC